MKINLSIIIPIYNAQKTLLRCLNSIKNQRFKDGLIVEIILIIDDGKKYDDLIPKMEKKIKIKILKTNGIKTGPGNTRNIGIKKARGEYIGFLDSDDEWSENYLEKMYKMVKKNGLAFAPTRVYRNENLLKEFKGKDQNYLSISDIGNIPCSFHPFVKRKKQGEFLNLRSQDVYNTSYLINKNKQKIKMTKEVYYKLNLQKISVTKEDGFSHKINIAYRKYQIKSLKNGNYKVARVFALRRINNKKFLIWNKNNNGDFYDYLSQRV